MPSNLLFFPASMLLLVISIQLSYELGRLEERTRTLAEEVALLRLRLEQLTADDPRRPGRGHRGTTSGETPAEDGRRPAP